MIYTETSHFFILTIIFCNQFFLSILHAYINFSIKILLMYLNRIVL